jgi:hypothetical protein
MSGVIVVMLMVIAVPDGVAGTSPVAIVDGCRLQCLIEAIETFQACVGEGGDLEECVAVARETYDTCVADCEVSCEEQCIIDTGTMFHECVEGGGAPVQCAQAAQDFLCECLEGCDEPAAAQPPPAGVARPVAEPADQQAEVVIDIDADSCEYQCALDAVVVFWDCTAEGGGFEECFLQAEEAFAICLAECDPSCERQCIQDGQDFLEDCIDAGGDPIQCARQAGVMIQECLEGCDD